MRTLPSRLFVRPLSQFPSIPAANFEMESANQESIALLEAIRNHRGVERGVAVWTSLSGKYIKEELCGPPL